MYKEKIINVQTGEETWRDYTREEIAEIEKSQVDAAARAQANAEAEAKREAALSKLAALGLTADDFKALGL